MPGLEKLGLDINPSADPEHYPGALVTSSCLVTGSWLYPLRVQAGERLGTAWLELDGGPLSGHGTGLSLDELLAAAGVAVMDDRYPVLAVGSNAAPGQLRHKFGLTGDTSDIVPLTRPTVRGVGVGHSPHVSKAGYVPYVPIAGDCEATRDLFVLWLDADQVVQIDATEPNYFPTVVFGSQFPTELENGEHLERYALYRGKWGALTAESGGTCVPATTQPDVYQLLAGFGWFTALVPEVANGSRAALAALGADEERRGLVRDVMAREGMAGPDGLPQHSEDPVPYRHATR